MKNTIEEKQRFFAQYWGQLYYDDFYSGFRTLNGLMIGQIDLKNTNDYLELTPLSMISDEHAIEVAKILHGDEGDFEIVFNASGNTSVSAYGRPSYAPCIEIMWNGNVSYEQALELQISHAYDYLRSKGYALPWMGVTVEQQIEWGWVKLKTT